MRVFDVEASKLTETFLLLEYTILKQKNINNGHYCLKT